jgi:hypothetical protein
MSCPGIRMEEESYDTPLSLQLVPKPGLELSTSRLQVEPVATPTVMLLRYLAFRGIVLIRNRTYVLFLSTWGKCASQY